MASAITHVVVGAGVALPASRRRMTVVAALLAGAPDFDTLAMWSFHIPYAGFFGHRGFFHSPFFLILSATLLALGAARPAWREAAIVWSVAAVTHPLLDALTDGGLGVMLLFPFSSARLFFPWRPISVSPLGITDFFDEAGEILGSEWPFALAAVVGGAVVRYWRRRP